MPYTTSNSIAGSTVRVSVPGYKFSGRKYSGVYFGRSGSDRNGRQSPNRRVISHYKQVPITVYNGPRLAFKVRGRDGKLHWARQPITSYKTVPVYTRFVQLSKELLVPNDLLTIFTRVISDEPTGSLTVYNKSDNKEVGTVTGDIAYVPFRFAWGDGYINSLYDYLPPSGPRAVNEIPTVILAEVDRLRTRAIDKLYEKAKNQKVNLGQAIAERKQTLNMFADLSKRLAKTLLQAKRGNLVRAAKELFPTSTKELANDYLMYKYGIAPLVSDLNGLAEKLSEPMKEVVYDINSKSSSGLQTFSIHNESNNIRLRVDSRVEIIAEKIEVKYKSRVSVSNSGLESAKDFGLLNIPALGWELIPFSFVADWVLPIGDFVNNLDAFVGLKHLWTTETIYVSYRVVYYRKLSNSSNPNSDWKTDGSYEQTGQSIVTLCSRTMHNAIPPLRLKESKSPTSNNWITAAALFLQRK